MTRATLFLAVSPDMRSRIESTIENLLALLDVIDGDENREPDLAGFGPHSMDDREHDDDFELSLGCSGDFEFDPAEDDEPGLIEGGEGL